jgi:hypothetical protein
MHEYQAKSWKAAVKIDRAPRLSLFTPVMSQEEGRSSSSRMYTRSKATSRGNMRWKNRKETAVAKSPRGKLPLSLLSVHDAVWFRTFSPVLSL